MNPDRVSIPNDIRGQLKSRSGLELVPVSFTEPLIFFSILVPIHLSM